MRLLLGEWSYILGYIETPEDDGVYDNPEHLNIENEVFAGQELASDSEEGDTEEANHHYVSDFNDQEEPQQQVRVNRTIFCHS